MSTAPSSSVFSPWGYFFVFVLSNSLISYWDLPNHIKIILVGIGILGPMLWALRVLPAKALSGDFAFDQEFLPSIPKWGWIALGIVILFYPFFPIRLSHSPAERR